jgi:DNA-binding MarR family transcriptional regulator
MAQVTSAVHQRQLAGMTTTLRQLHTATELDQPVALNLVAELERAGIVIIDRNIGDAFESTITLSEEARRQLELATAQKAKAAAA